MFRDGAKRGQVPRQQHVSLLIFTEMKTLDLIGYHREVGGKKSELTKLRTEGSVPCVLYGGEENVHFHTPEILFRELVYTPNVSFVNMDIEGTEYKCILQDVQFHAVSEQILHADFLLLSDDKEVKMDIPVKFVGNAPGVQQGGKLVTKLRKVSVSALPANMPEFIEVSIDGLELGRSIKIGQLEPKDYTILNHPMVTIGTISIPRALKSAQSKGEGETEEA